MHQPPRCVLPRSAEIRRRTSGDTTMDFAPTEQPEGLPDGQPAEQSESRPQYVAPIQPVAPSSRRSLPLIAGAILAGAIGLTAVAVGLASAGAPATAAPAPANARGVLLGAATCRCPRQAGRPGRL